MTDQTRFAGPVAVVTGGAQGIGSAIADRLLRGGAEVAILDINPEQGSRTAQELSDLGHPAHFVACDVGQEVDVARAFGEIANEHGPVRVLVNNAGINAYYDATTMTEDQWNEVMAVDLKGTWLCSKYAIPVMRSAGGGVIINIASIHAFMTTKSMFPYAAAKAGVVGMTRSLALDHGPDNIRVNAICPGWVRTRLVEEWLAMQPDPGAAERQVLLVHPLGRIGTPEDIANLVAFLASDEAGFITGAAIVIDGGLSARFSS